MKDVWAACRFRSDVISADFSKAKFAVELHEFLDGTADRTYQDPQAFFENTFLTDQMKLLVRDTLARLDNGGGQPVSVIDTGFGGGKTHSLLLLHHIISSPDSGLNFVRDRGISADVGIDAIPQARIIEIDCRRITKNTLWGEIAHRLGRYAEFGDMDRRREPPTDITMLKRLFEGPVLVMLDELPHYLFKADSIKAGAKTLGEITIPFIMDLISAVASTQRACLILTLTENQSLYEDYSRSIRDKINKKMSDFRVDELTGNLSEAISRQAHVMTPVNPDQIYDVIRARLVEHVDGDARRSTIQEYARYYEKHGMEVGDILDKIERSYPFHPSLIDILHERVSTIGKFNQTRGMLRLLARIVRQVIEEKPACGIIGTSEVRLDNADIKNELTVRLDNNLGPVMDADCVGHATEADHTRSVRVVGPVAATVMLFSLHGHPKRSGMGRGEIKAAMCHPGLDPSLVDKALDEDIMHNFWYIHDVGGQMFYFDEFPNIVAIIDHHKRQVTRTETKEEIRRALAGLLPKGGMDSLPCLWDGSMEDDNNLKLFVAGYDMDMSGDTGTNFMADMLNRSGDGIRTNKNTIVVVYADRDHVQLMERTARTLVGIKKARKDERVEADKQFMKQIASRESDAAAQLRSDCLNSYSNIMYPQGVTIRRSEIQFGESKKTTITEAVVDLLERQGKLVRKIGPDGLEVGNEPVKIRQMYERFTADRSKPFVLDMRSIGEAVKDGLSAGKFGHFIEIKMNGDRYVAEKVVDFDWDGYIVDSGMVHIPEKRTTTGGGGQGGQNRGENGGSGIAPKFSYKIHLDDFEEIHKVVKKIPIFNLDEDWKASKKKLRVNLNVGEICLDISGTIADHTLLKNVLNIISAKKPSGSATIVVMSSHDLAKFFRDSELEGYIQ